jgi:hypothetical protein
MRALLAAFLLVTLGIAAVPVVAQPADQANAATNTADSINQAQAPGDQATPPATNSAGGNAMQGNATGANNPGVSGAGAGQPAVLPESGQALVQLFVLAVLLESALALLFNWRPFVVYLDGRAVKPLVSFIAALVVVWTFRTDIFAELLKAYGGDLSGSGLTVSRILEAMVLAGGSSGVNTMLRGLGFRAIPTAERQQEQRPPPDKAWLAVRLHGNPAQLTVLVELADISTAAAKAAPQFSIAGTITGSTRKSGVASFFLRDFGRFPPAQGFAVVPDKTYLVQVRLQDGAAGQDPKEVRLAPGAIVDLDFTI